MIERVEKDHDKTNRSGKDVARFLWLALLAIAGATAAGPFLYVKSVTDFSRLLLLRSFAKV